jgi:hypothetical protein
VKRFNEALAKIITSGVGTMYCAYIFGLMGGLGVYAALTGNTHIVLIVGAISGYFLQLVLLPIIMVGQQIQSEHTIKHVKKHMDEHHLEHMLHMKSIYARLNTKKGK